MPARPPRSASDNLHDPDDEEIDQDLELPPLDADEDDELPLDAVPELPDSADDAGGLDDAASTELDVGDELDELDDDDGGDAEADVDVGPLDEGIDDDGEGALPGDDDEGAADEEGLATDEPQDSDDGGAEGTSENPEDEVDEASLPEIDDGDEEGGDQLSEVLLAEAGGDLPAWATARVVLVDGAGAALPCRSLAVVAGRVAAAGEVLLFVDEGARAARRLAFAEGVVAVALAEDAVLVATARGQLVTSRDAGTEATSLGAYRTGHPQTPGAGAPDVQLAATPGRFWIRAGSALSCVTLPASAPSSVRERGVLAIAASGGTLLAITLGLEGPCIDRFRGDDEGDMEARLAGPARALVERGRHALLLAVTAGGRTVALGDDRSVVVSRDGGATFATFEPGPVVAIAFAGTEVDDPLLALAAPGASGLAYLVEMKAGGEIARIGEVSCAEGELPAAIAWDPSREVIWVASGAGLIALGMPRRH